MIDRDDFLVHIFEVVERQCRGVKFFDVDFYESTTHFVSYALLSVDYEAELIAFRHDREGKLVFYLTWNDIENFICLKQKIENELNTVVLLPAHGTMAPFEFGAFMDRYMKEMNIDDKD